MVAITVILAAVIAAFVMGIGPGGESVTGSVSVSGDGTGSPSVDITDGDDADAIVLVDNSGQIAAHSSSANSGATLELIEGGMIEDSSSGFSSDFTWYSDYKTGSTDVEFTTNDGSTTEREFDIYLIGGGVSVGDLLESADGSLKVGSVTVQEP